MLKVHIHLHKSSLTATLGIIPIVIVVLTFLKKGFKPPY